MAIARINRITRKIKPERFVDTSIGSAIKKSSFVFGQVYRKFISRGGKLQGKFMQPIFCEICRKFFANFKKLQLFADKFYDILYTEGEGAIF